MKRFDHSNGVDTALYKNYFFVSFIRAWCVAVLVRSKRNPRQNSCTRDDSPRLVEYVPER